MSWMSKLYQTYEAAQELPIPMEDRPLPEGHITQNAHINIIIDGTGNFKRAKVLEKPQIVLPATESSAGRSGKEPPPHPLADKLQYVAKDYAQFGGKKRAFFSEYERQLINWCSSPYAHPKVKAVLKYVQKGSVIKDLTEHGITWCSSKGLLITKADQLTPEDAERALLLKILPKVEKECDQGSALVCWTVENPGDPEGDTWKDISIQESWKNYLASQESTKTLCYVTGIEKTTMSNHPKGIRHSGDGAKLLSSNDDTGFTYRGRFENAHQAASVSSETSQKAHSALRWLIDKQGFRSGDQAIIAWAVSCKEIPSPYEGIPEYDMDNYDDDIDAHIIKNFSETKIDLTTDLGASYAEKLKLYIGGYKTKLEPQESVVIMAIDSASPGRMAITYYREYGAYEYIENLSKWHKDFAWFQRVTTKNKFKKEEKKIFWDISSPSLYKVMNTTYKNIIKSNEKLKNFTFERLLPCIIDGHNIPFDILTSCYNRACSPLKGNHWEWEESLGVACALFKGFYARHGDIKKRRRYIVGLDVENRSRNYLYGRLLAMAERIESFALAKSGEVRPTTAERLMQRFAERPYSTWRTIELSLQPYLQRLQRSNGGFINNRKREMDEVMALFQEADFTNDAALKGDFLLGFHSQRLELRKKKEADSEDESPNLTNNN